MAEKWESFRRRPRTVRQVFRISAVRRPPRQPPVSETTELATPVRTPRLSRWLFGRRGGDRASLAPQAPKDAREPVTDEALVEALLLNKHTLEKRIAEQATKDLPTRCQVLAVTVEDVRPGGSVLLRLRFRTKVKGSAVAAVFNAAAAVTVAVREVLENVLRADVAVSAAPEPAILPASGAKTTWDRLAPILAAIATGVGVIGFVTFVGGVIVWARLTANGFAAAPALGVFPSQDLLVIGAQTLVRQVIWAFIAVTGLLVIYVLLRIWSDRVSDEEATVLAGHASLFAATGMFVFVLLAFAIALVPFDSEMRDDDVVVAWGVVIGGAFLAAAIGSLTHRVLYLMTATFVLVGTFLGLVAYWRARNDTAVRAAALVRQNKKAMAGIFVAEGAGRVYLARVSLRHDGSLDDARSRLVGIAKSQITDIAISEAKPVEEALTQARHLARELCQLQPTLPPPKSGTIEPCRTAAPGHVQPTPTGHGDN
jgi:hypothetical protein